MPLPVAFDGFIEQSKRVSPTCLICSERTRYSVPASRQPPHQLADLSGSVGRGGRRPDPV